MSFLKSAFAAATLAASSAAAWEIKVAASGGNATGIHHYGFLHEVRLSLFSCRYLSLLPTLGAIEWRKRLV